MSTSSDNETPSVENQGDNQVISVNWDEFSQQLDIVDRAEFACWLDDELAEMEAKLERFVTKRASQNDRR